MPNSTSASLVDPVIPRSLVDALKETFSVQLSTPIEISKVETTFSYPLPEIVLVSAIGMTSSKFVGKLAICFSDRVFLHILNKMLGENYTEVTNENSDGAGEILNIIYASARAKINENGHDFGMAIPTTTLGTKLQISHSSAEKVVRVTCHCESGDFYVEISLRKTNK